MATGTVGSAPFLLFLLGRRRRGTRHGRRCRELRQVDRRGRHGTGNACGAGVAGHADARLATEELRQLCSVSGEFDYMALLRAESTTRLDALLDEIGAIDGVRKTTTSVLLARRIDRGAQA